MLPHGSRINIGRLAGVPIFVDWTWFIIFALVTWSLAVGVLPRMEVEPNTAGVWLLAAAGSLLYLLCILLHELAHCLVAQKECVPIRDITLFLFGGVATMEEEPPNAGSELRIALAGPASNVALAALCYGEARAFEQFVFTQQVATVFYILCVLNLVIAAFNQVPAFPLDGGRVFRAALWIILGNLRRATFVATLVGEGFGLALALLGAWAMLRANPLSGLWLLFLGWFLFNAAFEAYSQLRLREALEGVRIAELIPTVPDLDPASEEWKVGRMEEGGPASFNGHRAASNLSTLPTSNDLIVAPDDDAWDVFCEMTAAGVYRAVVMDKERVVGLLSRQILVKVLRRVSECNAPAGAAPPLVEEIHEPGAEVRLPESPEETHHEST